MKCKNCYASLTNKVKFCSNCGAKVVSERISFRRLYGEFAAQFLGWDNRYFKTLLFLLTKPHVLINDYLSGVRKRYSHPFVFFAINAAIALIIFGLFPQKEFPSATAKDLDGNTIELTQAQKDSLKGVVHINEDDKDFLEANAKFNKWYSAIDDFEDRYFNFYVFLLLPLFTLMAFAVFRKPYNYGEHLIVNTYITGFLLLLIILTFLLEFAFVHTFGVYTFFISVFYYSFVYKKLIKYSFVKMIWKIIKFFLFLLVFFILATGLSYLVAYLISIFD